jgi:hypothetical protein
VLVPGKKYLVDPPTGWAYGFPALWDGVTPLEEVLRKHKYPEKEIEFALQHMRFIEAFGEDEILK